MSVAGRGGFRIRRLEQDEIAELYGARASIEGFAARLLAETGGPETFDRLRKQIAAAEGHFDHSAHSRV